MPDGRPLIELHALEGGGEVLALYGAVVDPYRFSAMFNTYTLSPHARHSPGLILLQHMIGACAQRGARSFDIGVGRAHYKSFFCKEPEPLFDTFLALTAARPPGRPGLPDDVCGQAHDQVQAGAVGGGAIPAPRARGLAGLVSSFEIGTRSTILRSSPRT